MSDCNTQNGDTGPRSNEEDVALSSKDCAGTDGDSSAHKDKEPCSDGEGDAPISSNGHAGTEEGDGSTQKYKEPCYNGEDDAVIPSNDCAGKEGDSSTQKDRKPHSNGSGDHIAQSSNGRHQEDNGSAAGESGGLYAKLIAWLSSLPSWAKELPSWLNGRYRENGLRHFLTTKCYKYLLVSAVFFLLVGAFYYRVRWSKRVNKESAIEFRGNATAVDISEHSAWRGNIETKIQGCIPNRETTDDPQIQNFFEHASLAEAEDMNAAMNRYLYHAIIHAVVLGNRFASPTKILQKVGKDDVKTYLSSMVDKMTSEEINAGDDEFEFNEMKRYLYLTIVQAGVLRSKYPPPPIHKINPEPKIDKTEPKIHDDNPEPKIDKTEPKINDDKLEPKIDKTEPKINDDKTEPKINDDKSEPKINDDKTEPKINDDKTEPKINDDKSEPKINDDKSEPMIDEDKPQHKMDDDKPEPENIKPKDDGHQKTIDSLRKELQSLRKIQKELQEKNDEITRLKKYVQQRDQTITGLHQEVETLKSELETCRTTCGNCHQRCDNCKLPTAEHEAAGGDGGEGGKKKNGDKI